jgi:hypothetical protein
MSMSSDGLTYHCEGFYPLEAENLVHAALLFAVWKARRQFGPTGHCNALLQTNQGPNGATFEALIDTPSGIETCQVTVFVGH